MKTTNQNDPYSKNRFLGKEILKIYIRELDKTEHHKDDFVGDTWNVPRKTSTRRRGQIDGNCKKKIQLEPLRLLICRTPTSRPYHRTSLRDIKDVNLQER